MASVVDTNVLVYVHDPGSPAKQKAAIEILDRGVVDGSLRVPHQAVVEFVFAVTRRPRGGRSLLEMPEALREADEILQGFEVLYPTEELLRTALGGAALYGLSWYDAHLWAYAEHYGCDTILSEDFQHDRIYGSVRVVNPFLPGSPTRPA